FTIRSPAVIGIDLDPVGAPADLIANDARQAVDSIGFLGALRNAPLGSITLRGIATRCHDRARDGEHARTGDDALSDGVPHATIGISRALRPEIANGCETCQ